MVNIERLNIEVKVKGGIEGNINPYKYNVNTDIKSKSTRLYTPTQYSLTNNASKISKLKDISLYSDKDRLEDFLKKTTSTNGNKEKNIKFIIKLLFKKNSKFYIKNWQFIVNKNVQDADISIKSNAHSTDAASVSKLALKKKYEEIKKRIERSYEGLPKEEYKNYETNIKKQIMTEYNKFINNNAERAEYIKQFRIKHIDELNKITVELVLIPNKQAAEYMIKNGFNISTRYLPRYRNCKSQKKQIYEEFMELLCTTPSVIPPTTATTNKYMKKINKARELSRKYVGQPSKDFPFCVTYNNRIKKTRKILTVKTLPTMPADLQLNKITRKTNMTLKK